MYTQCPECLSIYEISQEQLRQSRGNVQCSVCDTRFRAQVRLASSLKSPLFERPKPKLDSNLATRSPPERSKLAQPRGPEAKPPTTPTASRPPSQPTADPEAAPKTEPKPQQAPSRPATAGAARSATNAATRTSAMGTGHHSRGTPPEGHQPELTDWALATIDAEAGMEPLIQRPHQAAASNNESMPAVLDRADGSSKRWRLVIACLVSLAALLAVAQTAWLLRQPLSELPVIGVFVKPWCGSACRQRGAGQDIGNWQIADRRIHAHPRVEGVILVEVTIRNAAQTDSTYPALRLRLLDDNQQLVAERTLLPDAYMRELRPSDRLSAGALLPLSVAIEAPRRPWSHYELELFASVAL